MTLTNNVPLWIAEDITWPLLWSFLAGGVLVFLWIATQQQKFLAGSLVIVALIVSLLVVEQRLVTDREYLVDAVYTLATAVENNDPDGIVQFVRDENQVFRNRIYSEMRRYEFDSCTVNGFNKTDIKERADGTPYAEFNFSVWVTASYAGDARDHSVIVVIQLEFEKRNDKWAIEAYGYRLANARREIEMVRN